MHVRPSCPAVEPVSLSMLGPYVKLVDMGLLSRKRTEDMAALVVINNFCRRLISLAPLFAPGCSSVHGGD
jgi:hypothetical protein